MSKRAAKSQASSARAASTLGGFGASAAAFGASTSTLAYVTEPPDLSAIADPNVVVYFRNLSKRDSTTKGKALEDLQAHVASSQAPVEEGLLEAWAQIYPRTSIDNAKAVRQNAHLLHGQLATLAGKRIAKHMPPTVAAWLCGLYDSDRSVVDAAQTSLRQAFTTPAKLQNIRKAYQQPLLAYARDAIDKESPGTLSDERTASPDDAQAKYSRVVSACVALLASLLSNLQPEELAKCQSDYDGLLRGKKLWDFATHDDPSIRRALHRFLKTALSKQSDALAANLDTVSKSYLSVALNSDQTGSASDYLDALTALTATRPSVWTDNYKSKTTVDRRLRQFLKKGSQFAPRDYWARLIALFRLLPRPVLPSNAADAAELLHALQAGIARKEEPKLSLEAAFSAYLDIVKTVVAPLSSHDQGKVREELVLPLLFQYLRPSPETSQWSLPTSATSVLKKAVSADGIPALLEQKWPEVAQQLIDAIKTSAPEQAKDYDKSQTAVMQHGTRFATLQSQALEAETAGLLRPAFTVASSTVIAEALSVLQNRNGKPYGAAGVVAAILVQNRSLLTESETQRQLDTFLKDDLPSLILSPSSSYLVDILYSLSDTSPFKESWAAALKAVLKENESPARTKALDALLTSSKIPADFDLASSDQELQNFAKKSVTDAVDGSLEWDAFSCILQSPARILAPATTDEILSQLSESLTISDRTANALHGLRQIIKTNPSVFKDFVTTENGSKLLQTLLLASESPNDAIAQSATAVNTSLQTLLSSGTDSKQSVYSLIQSGLHEAKPTSVSVETLVDLAKQSINPGDEWSTLQRIHPDIDSWTSALGPFLDTPPRISLGITNPLSSAVYLIDRNSPATDPRSMPRDPDGYSAAYRIASYLIKLYKLPESSGFDEVPAEVRASYRRLLVFTLQLADDNLGLAGANGLWADYNPDVESDIMAFMSDAHAFVKNETRIMLSTWADNEAKSDNALLTWALSMLSSLDGTTTPFNYYQARACGILINEMVEIAGWKTSLISHMHEELKALRRDKSASVFKLLAYLVSFKDPLAASKSCERICNELIADLTGVNIEEKAGKGLEQLVLLNNILYNQDGLAETVAKQRLVFFVKHIVPWLQEPSMLRSIKAEVCRALTILLPMMKEMYGEHWSDILDSLAAAWSATSALQENESDMNSPIPFVHASLKLYSQLRVLTQEDEPNDDLVDAWKETEQDVANGLINLLKHSQHFRDEFHRPLKMVNDVLARQIAKVSLQHLESTEELFPLLYVESQPVQQTAFNILHKQIPVAQDQISIDAALEKSTARLPEELLSLIIDAPTVAALAEANFERSIPLPLRGYLLSWLLVFDHLEHASFKVKNDYVDHIKEGDYLPGLLNFTFDILGHAHNKPIDVSKLDVTTYIPDVEPPKRDLQWLLTHIYFLCLRHVPSLTKAWFIDCKSRATVVTLEPWTERHISPPVIVAALQSVTSWSDEQAESDNDSPFSVKVAPRAREITALYMVDEQTMAMRISLPAAFPLANAHIDSINRVAVNEQKWQSWLRTSLGAITIFNGSLIDALTTFKRNVDGAMKGQTECAICYSIVGSDRKLPDKRCQTCKNLFHGSCLFKWFRTSGSSSCPLCRNPFNYG